MTPARRAGGRRPGVPEGEAPAPSTTPAQEDEPTAAEPSGAEGALEPSIEETAALQKSEQELVEDAGPPPPTPEPAKRRKPIGAGGQDCSTIPRLGAGFKSLWESNDTLNLIRNDLDESGNPQGRRSIRRGDEGAAVELVQLALLEWGCSESPPFNVLPTFGADRDFGGETAAAVRLFQRAFAEPVFGKKVRSGVVDLPTFLALDFVVRSATFEDFQPGSKDPDRPKGDERAPFDPKAFELESEFRGTDSDPVAGIFFPTAKFGLGTDDRDVLGRVASGIGDLKAGGNTVGLRFDGHADRRGSASFNLGLSLDRLSEVAKFLLRKLVQSGANSAVTSLDTRPLGEMEADQRTTDFRSLGLDRRVDVRLGINAPPPPKPVTIEITPTQLARLFADPKAVRRAAIDKLLLGASGTQTGVDLVAEFGGRTVLGGAAAVAGIALFILSVANEFDKMKVKGPHAALWTAGGAYALTDQVFMGTSRSIDPNALAGKFEEIAKQPLAGGDAAALRRQFVAGYDEMAARISKIRASDPERFDAMFRFVRGDRSVADLTAEDFKGAAPILNEMWKEIFRATVPQDAAIERKLLELKTLKSYPDFAPPS